MPKSGEAVRAADPALATLLNELLQRRLRHAIGAERFGPQDRLVDWRSGLVDGIAPEAMTGRLQAMCPRLARPESAMALIINSFLPWQACLATLRLADAQGFTELYFGTRCPTGVRGTPPNVDVVASGPGVVAAATVRVFDYLAPKRAALSAGYRSLQVPEGMAAWGRLVQDGGSFTHVDVAGLAKVALGLSRVFQHRPIRLLYLFLEPRNPDEAAFAAHRAEIAQVVEGVAGCDVGFGACSLHELWQGWCSDDTPAGVRAIAAELGRRYAVVMPRRGSL